MQKSNIFGEVVRDPNFRQGQKVNADQMIDAIDRLYDKRYPVVPNAKVKGGVEPTQQMIMSDENKKRTVFKPKKKK